MNTRMRTPLGRVLGLGSARGGTEHFWLTRVTSVALVPLVMLAVVIAMLMTGADHIRARAVFTSPFVALPLLGALVVGLVHMRLGMQVVIEDYVHAEGAKVALLMANTFFCYALGAFGAYALIALVLGG